jgi:hypothetical protein
MFFFLFFLLECHFGCIIFFHCFLFIFASLCTSSLIFNASSYSFFNFLIIFCFHLLCKLVFPWLIVLFFCISYSTHFIFVVIIHFCCCQRFIHNWGSKKRKNDLGLLWGYFLQITFISNKFK